MTAEQKWDYLTQLDDELLKGGVILSEWASFLVRDADTAFCSGANLAALLTALAAIEAHLRFEYFDPAESKGWGLYRLLQELESRTKVEDDLVADLHTLRRYRNRWVHVSDPADDEHLLSKPEITERGNEKMALLAIRSMRRLLYQEQWV